MARAHLLERRRQPPERLIQRRLAQARSPDQIGVVDVRKRRLANDASHMELDQLRRGDSQRVLGERDAFGVGRSGGEHAPIIWPAPDGVKSRIVIKRWIPVGSFELREQIRHRLADETGTIRRQATRRVALTYPSPYHVGMSSLGFQAIYRALNQAPGWACERAFLPDDMAAHRRSRLPLVTYEGEHPIGDCQLIAFSVAYELEISGLIDCLELAGLPLLGAERGAQHP